MWIHFHVYGWNDSSTLFNTGQRRRERLLIGEQPCSSSGKTRRSYRRRLPELVISGCAPFTRRNMPGIVDKRVENGLHTLPDTWGHLRVRSASIELAILGLYSSPRAPAEIMSQFRYDLELFHNKQAPFCVRCFGTS